jgi:hypothetical protein
MAESKIDLILRVLREGDDSKVTTEELKEMKNGLTNLEKAALGVRSTIGSLDKNINLFGKDIGSAADILSGFGAMIPITPMDAFGQAIQLGAQYTREAISDYEAYVDEISKMASFTSVSNEEMSRMYQLSRDLQIEVGGLQTALETMTDKGTAASIEGLASLSNQYLALETPLERSQFLMENFSGGAKDMARMMDLGGDAILNMSDDMASWLIVSDESEIAIQRYTEAMNNWEDSTNSFKFSLANGLMPVITEFINMINDPRSKSAQAKWFLSMFDRDTYFDLVGGNDTSITNTGSSNNSSNVNRSSGYTTTSMPGGFATKYNPSGRADGGMGEPFETYKVGEREAEFITFGSAGGTVTPASARGGDLYLTVRPMIMASDEMELKRMMYPIFEQWQQGK